MTLLSPGVEITVSDESVYTPAPKGTIPFVVIATAENKLTPSGLDIAPGTTAANAGALWLITSQRELVNAFGNPIFYAPNGVPVHGYELNEYGLFTAYSALGTGQQAYVMRADIDLAALASTSERPKSDPANGTNWLDTSLTQWGIFEWNSATSQFASVTPLVITDEIYLDGGVLTNPPAGEVGVPGDYAVNTLNTSNPVYYKNPVDGLWQIVGGLDWQISHPTVQSAASPNSLNTDTLTLNGDPVTLIGGTAAQIAQDINDAAITGVTAEMNSGGRVDIYVDATAAGGAGSVLLAATGTIASFFTAGTYFRPMFTPAKHTAQPQWRSFDATPRPSGSVWLKTTSPNLGALFAVKRWNSTAALWTGLDTTLAVNDETALKELDPVGGGLNIPTGTIYVQYDPAKDTYEELAYTLFQRESGVTRVVGSDTSPALVGGWSFTIQASTPGSSTLTGAATVTSATGTPQEFVTQVNNAGIPNVRANIESSGAVSLTHIKGGVLYLVDGANTPLADLGITANSAKVRAVGLTTTLLVSNWVEAVYTASASEPKRDPADGTLWYSNNTEDFDIMINDGTSWKGYRNVSTDSRGYNLVNTSADGPIVAASMPTENQAGGALVNGDLWIDTGNLEDFPKIYRWSLVESNDMWVQIDVTDQTSENGILFGDARFMGDATSDVVTGTIPTISAMQTNNYVDSDCPSYTLYPRGMLLWNTRRSFMNVKQYTVGAFPSLSYANTWTSVSGNTENGVAFLGRKAQRNMVVKAMVAVVSNSVELLEDQRPFNLLVAPGYPEMIQTLIQLNNNRKQTAFIIGDSPVRLQATGNTLNRWANNLDLASDNNEQGLVSNDGYLGVYYPAGFTRDLSGNGVVVPSSHMTLRTILRSDQQSYPWLAPAGLRRGSVDNALAIGYIEAATGEFKSIGLTGGLRDVLYDARVNPITVFPGSAGITVYGQKTRYPLNSALDRVNVARLIVYLRQQIDALARQYVFEPNDDITRKSIKANIEKELNDIKAKRGLYDYVVQCDESNNTPQRIDRNELWVDIAIEPVKAAEFIYIPIRVKNTGSIAAGQ